jgi:hypothetical protein
MEEAEAGWGPVAIRDSEHVNDLGVCSDRHLGEARDKVPLRTLLHFKSGRRGLQEEGGREGGRGADFSSLLPERRSWISSL